MLDWGIRIFGAHAGYILASYAIAALILGGMVVVTILQDVYTKKRLKIAEKAKNERR